MRAVRLAALAATMLVSAFLSDAAAATAMTISGPLVADGARRDPLEDPTRVVDLDRPELTRPLCSTIARTANPLWPDNGGLVESVPRFLPMAYSARRAIE